MGCHPSHPDKDTPVIPKFNSSRAVSIRPLPLTQRLLIREKTCIDVSKNEKRAHTARKSGKRFSSPPLALTDFWGTIPFSVILDRLHQFAEEIIKLNEDFNEIVEYIRNVLNEIASDFENSALRLIKKNNKGFKQYIGKFSQGVNVLKTLGFREKDDCVEIDDNLTAVHYKNKIKEFDHAVGIVISSKFKEVTKNVTIHV